MASRGGFLGHLLWLVLLQPLLGKGYSPSPGPTLTWGSPETTSPPELQTFPMPVSTTALGSSALTVGETWESTQTTGSQTLSPQGCRHRPMQVVGGVPVPRRKWPWQVSLQMEGKHVCGGFLIASQWVMTAAHCITGHKKYTVRLGGKSLYPNSTTTLVVPVEDIVCHRSFDATTLRHDIALVLLAFAVNYSSYIQPVCLPEKAFQAETGTECWVTGWGHLAEGLAPMPLPLQETEQHILHQKKCNRMLRSQLGRLHSIVKKGMICAYQDESKGLCKGDSGGPLVCEFNDTWVQVGIVSWGIGCGHRHYPAVYTEVSFYRDWVVDHLSQACAWDSAGFFIFLCLVLALGILVAP